MDIMKDLVSVIIPVYNQAEYVVSAIESVLEQSYGSVQILVIDDGSTDDSVKQIEAAFSNEINFIRQRNMGPSAAINAGLEIARGEFISLLGGDDIASSDRFASQVDQMKTTAHDILFSLPSLIDGDGNPLRDDEFPIFQLTNLSGSDLFSRLFYGGNFLCAPSVMFRRSVFEKLGGFHRGLVQLQDYDYWLRALSIDLSINVTDERGVYYRRHKDNLSREDRLSSANAEMCYVLKRVIDYGHPSVLRKAFSNSLSPTTDEDIPLSKLEKNIILMGHPTPECRVLAISEILTSMESMDEFPEEKKYGFNLLSYLYNNAGESKYDRIIARAGNAVGN